jgi:cell wall-associated NlpC family hydrolase
MDFLIFGEIRPTVKLRPISALFVCLIVIPLMAGADTSYTVRKGDTLSRIARWSGVNTRTLMECNGLDDDRLKPGMKLTIPSDASDGGKQAEPAKEPSERPAVKEASPAPTGTHTVRKGETLSSIAESYGMSVKELKKINHVRRPRRLKPGMELIVRKPSVPPPAVAPERTAVEISQAASEKKEPEGIAAAKEAGEPAAVRTAGIVLPGEGKGIRDKLVAIAREMLDIPYRFGGRTLLGIDCSGYVQRVFSLLDIALPRTAREQFRQGKLVDKDELSVGDLVFFRTYAKFPSHVGIYLGDSLFIHASAKDRKVKVDSLDAPYYIKRFIGARRLDFNEEEKGI